nr:protein 121 [synthetic construct]
MTISDTNIGQPLYYGHTCQCDAWEIPYGTDMEETAGNVMQIVTIAFSVLPLFFYAYSAWKATCGWEEVYVCIVELICMVLSYEFERQSPATLYLSTGNQVVLLRYSEWLFTCPVILIHLSNITGLKDNYTKRTMALIVSDIGCIVCGVLAASSQGPIKIVFFLMGLTYGCMTYYQAGRIYIEAYHMVPKGRCKLYVRLMAWIYFITWLCFPIWFLCGPEGYGVFSFYGSSVAHSISDIWSKMVWGFIGHNLRIEIHKHILKHGDIRKKVNVNIAGEEVNVETYVEEEDEETV